MQLVRSPVQSVIGQLVSMRAARPEWLPVGASLHLDYLNNRGFALGSGIALPTSLITFTRATSRTRINSAGALETVAINTPAIDYDPVTLACRGLSVWEARTNLALRSQEFDHAYWTKTRSSITANVTATTAPDGTLTADKLVEDATASASHEMSASFSVTSGVTYTHTIYAKAGERSFLSLTLFGAFTTTQAVMFTLAGAGAAIAIVGSAATYSITLGADGWYRCAVTMLCPTTGTGSTLLYLANAATLGGISYTGDGTSGLYIWGAQLEAGSSASPYIPTTTAQVTRAADVAVISGANFSNFYNQSEGSFVVEVAYEGLLRTAAAACSIVVEATATPAQDSIAIRAVSDPASPQADVVIRSSNVSRLDSAGFAPAVAGTIYKRALGYRVGSTSHYVNGVADVVDNATAALPTVDRLILGQAPNLYVRSLTYYPTRLTNAQLATLST